MDDDDKKNEQNADEAESQEGDNNEIDKGSKEFQEEIDNLEKEREKHKEKEKKEIERLRDGKKKVSEKEDEEEKIIGGQSVIVKKKNYIHKSEIFRHNRLNDFSSSGTRKIEKVMKKIHGVSLKKKLDFLRAMKAYNPTKSVLKRKDFDEFTRRFKSKRFTGDNFKKVEKEGIDIKSLRKQFGKRDIDKIKRGITGQENPYKYKSKGSDLRSAPPAENKSNKLSL